MVIQIILKRISLLLLIVLLFSFVLAIDLDSCDDSLTAGTYELTQDITADLDTCFVFTESNTTLDCHGYKIDGNSIYHTGAEALLVDNITIKNCIFENFLSYGVYIESSTQNNIQNSSILDIYDDTTPDGVGLYLFDVTESAFDNLLISRSYFDGVYFIESNYNNFTNSEVSDVLGEGYGFWIEDSEHNLFDSLIVADNIYGGMSLFDGLSVIGSNHNIIKNSRIINNGDDIEGGINIYNSYGNLFYNNFLNNTLNIYFDDSSNENFWNTTLISGTNIVGEDYIGGNYYTNPTGDDFSDNCASSTNGICDLTYDINGDGINVDYYPLALVIASDTTPPYFTQISNQTIYNNQSLKYDINATDETGFDSFSIDDTTNFSIDSLTGLIQNITILNVGNYIVNITINDTSNNVNSTIWELKVLNSTLPDTISPVISNIQNISITKNSSIITWNTDELANSTVNFGINSTNLDSNESNSTFVLNHSISLSNLTAFTNYFFNLVSCDSLNNCNTSETFNFTTLSCGDGTCNNGESCSSCSSDCGACPSGGGGGSSGGSSISFSSTKVVLNQTANETIQEPEVSNVSEETNTENEELPEEEPEEINKKGFFRSMGNSVSNLFLDQEEGKINWFRTIIASVIILGGLSIIFYRKFY